MSKPPLPDAAARGRQFTLIRPEHKLFQIDLAAIWRFRELIPLMVRRDFKAEFTQTVLGPVWFVIHPVMQAVVFAVIFGNLAKMSTEGATPFLFYNASFVMWTYFTQGSTYVSNVFIANAGLFSKIYFPRLIVPIATATFRLINMVVNFCVFMIFLAYFAWRGAKVEPSLWILATPLLALHTITLAVGTGLLASAFTTRYRDVIQAFGYMMSLWMYATPIIYPLSQVPERWHWVFYFNPMTSVVEVFRHAWLGVGSINFGMWIANMLATAVLFCVGVIAFNHTEKTVVDTV